MIKREMLTMMHYDAAYSPTEAQQGLQAGKKSQTNQKSIVTQAQHLAYLEHYPHEPVTQEEMESVSLCDDCLVFPPSRFIITKTD
jgi:hypothetical protein